MPLEWSAELSVGVPVIDAQHREVFDAVNSLIEAMKDGCGRARVRQTFEALGAYVTTHFETEERLMRETGYPELKHHCARHRAFVDAFVALKARFEKSGASASLTVDLQRSLCDWLREHVPDCDLKLARFLEAQPMQRNPAAGRAGAGARPGGETMTIVWDEELSVGVPLIDEQHQHIFEAINELFAAMRAGRGRNQLERTLQQLQAYVGTHFRTEEEHMEAHGYPGLEAHRAQHEAFAREFQQVFAEFLERGPSPAMAISLQRRLCNWLHHHIRGDDQALGEFLRRRRAG
jgi:hemerythrin